MAVLTIRNIDDSIKSDLRIRAAQHGRSMEEEVRCILAQVLRDTPGQLSAAPEVPFGTRLRQHFTGLGDIATPKRRPARAAPDFSARAVKSSA